MEKTKQQKIKDFLINNGVIIIMLILVVYTGISKSTFLTGDNLMNILMNLKALLNIVLKKILKKDILLMNY